MAAALPTLDDDTTATYLVVTRDLILVENKTTTVMGRKSAVVLCYVNCDIKDGREGMLVSAT